jgi:hypothetical protein
LGRTAVASSDLIVVGHLVPTATLSDQHSVGGLHVVPIYGRDGPRDASGRTGLGAEGQTDATLASR